MKFVHTDPCNPDYKVLEKWLYIFCSFIPKFSHLVMSTHARNRFCSLGSTVDSPVSRHLRESEKVSVSGVVRLREQFSQTDTCRIYEFCPPTGASTGDFQWYSHKMKLRMS